MVNINQWTQSVRVGNNILLGLERDDVFLLDEQGEPYAVLVSIERYEELRNRPPAR
jgi:hypothetical protein